MANKETKSTMREFASNDQANYYSCITSITVNGKNAYKLKGKFLEDWHNNSFYGTNGEDAIKHIEYFLIIVDPIDLPNLGGFDRNFFRKYYPPSRICDDVKTEVKKDPTDIAFEEWLVSKFSNHMMIDTFTKNVLRDFWKKNDDHGRVIDDGSSNLKKTDNDNEREIGEIFRIEINLFDYETLIWKNDGYCNGGNLLGSYIVGNSLHYQDFKWYKALEDGELKDEALRNKAIMEGIIDDDDDESSYNDDEKYVAIKEDEYDDSTSTSEEACRAYQEIFRMMNEEWMDELNKELIEYWDEFEPLLIADTFPLALSMLGARDQLPWRNPSFLSTRKRISNRCLASHEGNAVKLPWSQSVKRQYYQNLLSWSQRDNSRSPKCHCSNSDTDKIMARMDAMTIKMDAQYKELQSNAKEIKPDLDEDDIPMSREEEAKFMQTFHVSVINHDFIKVTFLDIQNSTETVAKNHQASIQNLKTKFDKLADKQSGRPSGSLPNEGSKILHSIEGTLLKEEIFVEFDKFMAMTVNENSDSESDTEEPPFEKITINTDYKIKTSLEEPPTDLELKPLPDNLEYVFLEEPSFLFVIISSQLSKEKKDKLVSVLKKHKEAFAWKTTDIPGIAHHSVNTRYNFWMTRNLLSKNKEG
ncbi:hypothetical protein Tco_0546795 [Tanacetum coccineum]